MRKKNRELIQVLSDISNVAGRMARHMKLMERCITVQKREKQKTSKKGAEYYGDGRRFIAGHC